MKASEVGYESLDCFRLAQDRDGNEPSGSMQGRTIINQLTPWSRVLPEKLTSPLLFRTLPAFYGTRRFITQ